MKAIAVKPGKPNTVHLTELPAPKVGDVPKGRGVLVRVLRVGVCASRFKPVAAVVAIDEICFGPAAGLDGIEGPDGLCGGNIGAVRNCP